MLFSASASLDIYSFRTESPYFKPEKTILLRKTGRVLSVLPHASSYIPITVFNLVQKHLKKNL